MNRYFIFSFAFLPVLVIAGVVTMFLVRPGEPAPSKAEGLAKDFELYAEIRQKLLAHYDGELDEDELRNAALKGLAHGTGDDYTRVLPPVATKGQDMDLEGRFFGIGVTVEQNVDGSLRITHIVQNGGADKAGLFKDDVIVAIDETSILGQPYEASVMRIKSNVENSVVVISVLRGGNPASGRDAGAKRLDVPVTRSAIESYSVHDAHMESAHGRRFGYLRVSEFVSNTYEQFKAAVDELASGGAEGFVIDLRGNSGGRVDTAREMVDSLLTQRDAVITFTRSTRESNREGDRVLKTRDDTAITSLPVVLLVDANTASAAELMAGALRDHGRAYVIGTRTFGKGVVQTIFKLSSDPNYTVNITTTQYFTPLGRRVQKGKNGEPGGVQPDLLLEWKSGEREKLYSRLRARTARYNIEEVKKQSNWWDFEDRMLQAALDFLAGTPVVIK